MRRALVVAVLLAVLAPAAAAAPRGAPDRLGTARAADHRDHPGALSEWWSLRLVDPRSRGWLDVVASREYELRGVRLIGEHPDGFPIAEGFGTPELAAGPGTLVAGGSSGRMTVRLGEGRVELAAPVASGTIRLRNARLGPAARGWRLGEAPQPGDAVGFRPVTLAWSMPIASSIARGSLLLPGNRRLDVRGWRASYEHGWGDLLPGDRAWEYWDQAVVHARRGVTLVAYGLNRFDTMTGPGARDAQWLGLLARVDARGVRICRPRVDRRRWAGLSPDLTLWSTRLRFRCGGLRLRYRDHPRRRRIDEFVTHAEIRGRIAGRRPGFSMHLAHPLL